MKEEIKYLCFHMSTSHGRLGRNNYHGRLLGTIYAATLEAFNYALMSDSPQQEGAHFMELPGLRQPLFITFL